jgi:hypothetical protein
VVNCQQCGAANSPTDTHCQRCGGALSAAGGDFAPAAAGALFAREANANVMPELGNGLELPEWLKRAAAETPEVRPVAPSLPGPEHENRTAQAAPLPTGDLATAMPNWLAAGAPGETQPAAYPPAAAENTATSSFISENDLPEWIRQLGAADALKAEEGRQAAEASRSAASEAGTQRSPLPGEASASAPAANPWLARRDRAGASVAWSAEGESTARAHTAPVAAKPAATAPATTPVANTAKRSGRGLPVPSSGKAGYALGAAVVLLIALVLFLVVL